MVLTFLDATVDQQIPFISAIAAMAGALVYIYKEKGKDAKEYQKQILENYQTNANLLEKTLTLFSEIASELKSHHTEESRKLLEKLDRNREEVLQAIRDNEAKRRI